MPFRNLNINMCLFYIANGSWGTEKECNAIGYFLTTGFQFYWYGNTCHPLVSAKLCFKTGCLCQLLLITYWALLKNLIFFNLIILSCFVTFISALCIWMSDRLWEEFQYPQSLLLKEDFLMFVMRSLWATAFHSSRICACRGTSPRCLKYH